MTVVDTPSLSGGRSSMYTSPLLMGPADAPAARSAANFSE
eukprot:CAMPEP_0197940806 /NCGR_PEP_ID=MMETSP1439-20131203/121817_1 /TAXON_ID=66791 /ORGANISM="Gonyaulax spinifera, Strain CCMP409" /LENGTH=39 /DNA_ID= /DNA_START= /DNA_END= /DNA_ORIENTATION=